ncbi:MULTISPECIES: helix-turn-helix domain-containing protein [Alphaproteobacteria]|uniref:helix-turn-helix domain-containing protein n=1 Tax=Alphaproteobacteria TaxID=28211 RepID=UPI003267D570
MAVFVDTTEWCTSTLPLSSRYDAWTHQLNSTFGNWCVPRQSSDEFDAKVLSKKIGSLQIVECVCDPCGGERTASVANAVDEEQLVIQLVLSGREHMRLGSQEARLQPGDLFVWDNTQPMMFEVTERLHKISALLPLRRFKDWMPDTWRNVPRHVPSTSMHSAIIGSYIQSLRHTDMSQSAVEDSSLIEATVALLSSGMGAEASGTSVRTSQLNYIKYKIRQQLHDPDLSLEQIANQNKISVRYLHYLFGGSGESAWQFVVSERLEKCKKDILNTDMDNKSITAIAYAWGFSDAAHFSRSFKRVFGMSPSQARLLR